MTRRTVRGERDAWILLEHSLGQDCDAVDNCQMHFAGWPRLDITVDPGDGHGTPQILRAISKLQSAVYRGYALLKYETPDARRLSLAERHALRIKWSVEKGSTRLPIDLSGAANEFARAAATRMSGAQAVRTVLASVLMFCSTTGLVAWLYFNADLRKEELRLQGQRELAAMAVKLSDEHTKQMQLLKTACEQDRTNVVRFAATDLVPWRSALIDMGPELGTITINSVKIEAAGAKKVARIASKAAKVERDHLARGKVPPVVEAGWVAKVTPALDLAPPPMRLGRMSRT